MSAEELERLLASLPTRQLPPAGEAQILSAITAATPRVRHWWGRSVPLWQTAAACLLAGLVGVSAGLWTPRSSEPAHSAPPARHSTASPVVAQVAPATAIFGRTARPAYVLDISRWQSQPASQKGEFIP